VESRIGHACLGHCLIGQGRLLRSEASQAPCGSLAAASLPFGALWLISVCSGGGWNKV
jgi:hypothetical protein